MKAALSVSLLSLGTAIAHPHLASRDDPYANWSPAGPDDVRAPCPMLNTLANHAFLPHDGKDITATDVENAFVHLAINATLADELFQFALTTNPTPNATTFSLDDLSRHNILEHDGSLSRLDAYFGNNHVFDEYTFAQTRSYWTSPAISVDQAAAARLARMYTSNATNPTFNISSLGAAFSVGETAAYILVFGNREAGLVNRTWIEYFFENERLPTSLGWETQTSPITGDQLGDMMERVENATAGSFPYPVPSNGTFDGQPQEQRRGLSARSVRGFHSPAVREIKA